MPAMGAATQIGGDGVSTRFARFAATLTPASIPPEVLAHARLCILDATGIALASRGHDYARSVLAAGRRLGGSGSAPVIGERDGLPLRDAVLVNGTLVHGLDFDDTHPGSVVHGTASAWPLAFTLGSTLGASGADALTACVLALELDARIGEVAEGGLQRRGFHPTGVVGAFGCAAAAAWLYRLDAARHAHALGIVLSMASGSMAFLADGAWTKRLHPGWAGVAGITAAGLAEAGFVGPGAPLEGRFGLYHTLLGDAVDVDDLGADLGREWRTPEVAFKPYPACHFNHAFADCALALRREHHIDADAIETITARIHPHQAAVVCEPLAAKQNPRNAYEAQFSVPFMVAAALVRGRFTLAELEDDALADPAIVGLARRVTHADDPHSAYPQYYSGGLVVRLRDGREFEHHIRYNRGADRNPMSATEIEDKFLANATRTLTASAANEVAEHIGALDEAGDLRALAAALTHGAATPAARTG